MTEQVGTDATSPARGKPDDEEILELFARMPDHRAREEIVIRFQPFAEYLARRFSSRGESIDDLTQVAAIGLLNAVDRFDAERGIQFSTYAAATIVGEIKRHFRDKGWALRVPRRLQELAMLVSHALPGLTQSLGRSPTIPELAEHLDVGTDDIVEAMDAVQAYSTSSLDAPADDHAKAPVDALGDEDPSLALLDEWATIAPAVAELSPRDRRVLFLRFLRGYTQSEIAEDVGVSQMHVSRILSRTLEQLRRVAES